MNLITLTTDFGLQDWFVGTMKGVILGINPRATIVDLTHGIRAGDAASAAFALACGCSHFPRGTVHVAVVDPGVGSQRGIIAVKTCRYYFLGPDNGVLTTALAGEQVERIHRVENHRYFLDTISRTFHGRDIFAPVAAWLSRGLSLRKLGPPVESFTQLDLPKPSVAGREFRGCVGYIDRFGNAITNIPNTAVEANSPGSLQVRVGRKRIPIHGFYGAVSTGKPVAVPGSTGFLEIAINRGSAEKELRLGVGTRVVVLMAET